MEIRKIMLVDDEPITNFINKRLLENHSTSYEVQDFTDPHKAFSAIHEFAPDLIFLDINMPGMDGWGFLESMAAGNMGTPVVMLTSSTSESDVQKSRDYVNVRHFSTKPLDPAKLGGLFEAI